MFLTHSTSALSVYLLIISLVYLFGFESFAMPDRVQTVILCTIFTVWFVYKFVFIYGQNILPSSPYL